MLRALLLLLLLAVSSPLLGQESATDIQIKLPSMNLSGAIAVTNTFQSIQVATKRHSCTVQNNGAATMWVFFGPIASATKAKSVVLAPGQSVYCSLSGVTLSDQVSITGTATDTFFAGVQ